MKKRKSQLSMHIPIRKSGLNLFWSDGVDFSRPERYKGYYITFIEYDPKTSQMGVNIMQRILPEISERTDENDKLAVNVLDDFTHAIEDVFNKHFKKNGYYREGSHSCY